MIFPLLIVESLVQEGDKTRLNASSSYAVGGDEITKIEIQPGADEDFIDVTALGYLDWQFTKSVAEDATEDFVVTVRINEADPDPGVTAEATVTVISEAADNLFSSDGVIRAQEPTIMNYVTEGRATFKDVHRRAQTLILDWLSKQGYTDDSGNRITKEAFVNIEESEPWSAAMTLRLIFEGVRNAKDDVFREKAKTYEGLEAFYRDKAILRLDLDGNSVASQDEGLDIRTARVFRR